MNNYQDKLPRIVKELMNSGAFKATYFIAPNFMVRAVRTKYKNEKTGKKAVKKIGNLEFTLTVGKPNFREREFVKLCQKAQVKFPLNKIQLKF